MSGPWQRYQSAATAQSGPWARYAGRPDPRTMDLEAANAGLPRATLERVANADQMAADDIALNSAPGVGPISKILQGVPFVGQYADEAAGAISNAIGGDPNVTQYMRDVQGAMDRQRPGAAMGYQIAGGVAGGLPLAAPVGAAYTAIGPTSLAGKVATGGLLGGVTGGVEGAVSGYGAGNDGDRAQTAGEWGILGGGLGTAIGAALPAVGAGASAGYRAVRDQVSSTPSQVPGMSRTASDRVLQSVGADSASPNALRGPDAMLADIGPATRGLLDEAVNVSPTGAAVAGRAVSDRAASTTGRLNTVFDDVLGGPEGIRSVQNAVRQSTQPGVKAAYRQAYSTPIDYSSEAGRKIESLIERLPARQVSRAVDLATDQMIYDGLPSPQIMARVGNDGRVAFEQMPNTIQLDYIKRAFDQIAQDSIDPITGRFSSQGNFANRIARDLADALGDANPAYRTALNEAADGFTLERAGQIGRKILSPQSTREDIAEWAARATDIERRVLGQTLRSDIDERMSNVVRAVSDGNMEAREAQKILRDMSSRSVRDKLETALGSDQAGRIFDALEETASALETRAAVAANSRTAARTEGTRRTQEAMQYEPGQIVRDAASGRMVDAPRRVLESAVGNTAADRAARQDEVYRQIAEYLTQRGPQATQSFQQAQGLLSAIPQQQANAGRFGAGTAGALGLLSYPTASQALRR